MHNDHSEPTLDALLPPQMAQRAEEIGVRKAGLDAASTLWLGFLGGAFIALGANFATVVTSGANGTWPWGIVRLFGGVAFSLGLILVIVGGAELFTGNNLIVMAWASGKISTRQVLRNWGLVYVGNLAGAIATAAVVFVSQQYRFGDGAIATTTLATANAKCQLDWPAAIALGALCNVLVCLAVWMSYSARSTTDRIFAIVPPVAAFVAGGFEHSIANGYTVPLGLFLKQWGPESLWQTLGKSPDMYSDLTWTDFLLRNMLPVTIGNVLGGAVMVGVVYWLIYLRKK